MNRCGARHLARGIGTLEFNKGGHMAKKNRPSVQKREREQMKRERERRKAEKNAEKRERRLHGGQDAKPAAEDADGIQPSLG